jgi:hypothetical protein
LCLVFLEWAIVVQPFGAIMFIVHATVLPFPVRAEDFGYPALIDELGHLAQFAAVAIATLTARLGIVIQPGFVQVHIATAMLTGHRAVQRAARQGLPAMADTRRTLIRMCGNAQRYCLP